MSHVTGRGWLAVVLVVVMPGALAVSFGDDAPQVNPPVKTTNSNTILKEYKGKLTLTASTAWPGWPADKLVDGNVQTSWFSNSGDAVAQGTNPWVQIELPASETIKRVTILGNREPSWPKGFSILSGKLELFDKNEKRIYADEMDAAGDGKDFEFKLKEAVKDVRLIRFTSLKDEGDQTVYKDIAIGEILVE